MSTPREPDSEDDLLQSGSQVEVEGPGPPSGDSERQLSPDRGGGKT
jgi:hypothetical protein